MLCVTYLQLVLLEVERLLCGGMFRAAAALRQLGCLEAPDTPFNSGELHHKVLVLAGFPCA
jgi:hypothetical protein